MSPPGRRRELGPRRFQTLVALVLGASCASGSWEGGPGDPATIDFAPELGVELAAMERTPSGLYTLDLEEGSGPSAQRGSLVSMNYATWLADGTLVDTSIGGEPFVLRLGGREVIPGWNEGIRGMRVGGRRRLVVRPGLAYGSGGSARVPGGATLVFELELLDVR